jgi:rhodanese-related sulfurtransferase
VAAKRVALSHSPQLRDAVVSYMSQPASLAPTIDPSAVTSAMTVVDVRPRQEYDAGHFPGSVSIPLDDLPDRFTELPQGGELVVYCRGEFCRMAREAATWLRAQGLDAKAMDEGIVEWRAAGECDLDQTA